MKDQALSSVAFDSKQRRKEISDAQLVGYYCNKRRDNL